MDIKEIFKEISDWKNFGFILVIILLLCLSSLPIQFNASIENATVDLLFKIRGSRQLSDKIVFIFIDDEDLKTLGEKGNWSISRDYYGYAVYMLSQLGARAVGIDVLFSTEDRAYPEYDVAMAEFISSAGNVCLPLAFSEITLDSTNQSPEHYFQGINPIYPLQSFQTAAAGLGFSNFQPDRVIRKVPLAAIYADRVIRSFGAELARLYLEKAGEVAADSDTIKENASGRDNFSMPVDRSGSMILNHFGDIENLNSISFTDFLQNYNPGQNSLEFKDKLVIIGVTAPGIVKLTSTPLSNALPATLIHATVAENLIEKNYLTEIPLFFRWLIIVLLGGLGWAIFRFHKKITIFAAGLGCLLLFWGIAILGFSMANLIIPLFYPTLACSATIIFIETRRSIDQRLQDYAIRVLMNEQIRNKESQLTAAKETLTAVRAQLSEKTSISEQSLQLARERENTISKLEKELRDLKTYSIPQKQLPKIESAEIIYAEQGKMAKVLELAATVSPDDIPVLILGETGTGKEMVARFIHNSSKRKNAPFIAINCGALSETLLESELFGHEKGSFTGAHSRRRGRFELADGGTIFLDEITETTPAFQTRLLRVLQESSFERIGGEQTISVDVRVIAATNKDLQSELANNRFRADLFYRLNGFPITLPPLRDRKEDIPLLAVHFLKKHGYHSVSSFSDQAMDVLLNYHWQGNVRELENAVRRAAIIAQSQQRNIIRENDLPEEILKYKLPPATTASFQSFEDQILGALRSFGFSRSAISQTAKALGNRDRGTITEYFRGICFEALVNSDFDIDQAAGVISNTTDGQVISRVRDKIEEYFNNLDIAAIEPGAEDSSADNLPPAFKGLPKKYHGYLRRVIEHCKNDD